MKKHGPVNVVFHYPRTDTGKDELSQRVAEVHADAVVRCIKNLNCPTSQKIELLDAVLAVTKQRSHIAFQFPASRSITMRKL